MTSSTPRSMRAKWSKWIRTLTWKLRPWTKIEQLERQNVAIHAKYKQQVAVNKTMEAALSRKRRSLRELQGRHEHVLKEVQRQRCTKIKHSDLNAAKKAAARLFNKTSHVMEPYECFVCGPKSPTNTDKWWHIRHALPSMRGKHGQVDVYLETPGTQHG